MKWESAPDIETEIGILISELKFIHLQKNRIFCFRGYGSSSRAIARIWSLPRIWQQALNTEPAYCLEVIAEKFDKLSRENKEKTLIHELVHIPQNFSGALVPHRKLKGKRFNENVNDFYDLFKKCLK